MRTFEFLNTETGQVITVESVEADPNPYRNAILKLEEKVSWIITVRGKHDWILNSLLHSRRVYPVYVRIKKFCLYGFGKGGFIDVL